MAFPNPQLLNALLDDYIRVKKETDWDRLTGKLKWKLSIWRFQFSKEDGKTQICTDLNTLFSQSPAADKQEQDKWSDICIQLGKYAKDDPLNLQAAYLQAIRTFNLSLFAADQTKIFQNLKEKVANFKKDEAKLTVEDKEKFDAAIMDLCYLGDEESIKYAEEKYLIPKAELHYFQKDYFKTKFFDTYIKTQAKHANHTSFESFIGSLVPVAPLEQKQETTTPEKATGFQPVPEAVLVTPPLAVLVAEKPVVVQKAVAVPEVKIDIPPIEIPAPMKLAPEKPRKEANGKAKVEPPKSVIVKDKSYAQATKEILSSSPPEEKVISKKVTFSVKEKKIRRKKANEVVVLPPPPKTPKLSNSDIFSLFAVGVDRPMPPPVPPLDDYRSKLRSRKSFKS